MKTKQLKAQNVPGIEVDTVPDDKDIKSIVSKGNHDNLFTLLDYTSRYYHLERGPYVLPRLCTIYLY